jgi:hypothetical protein
MSKKGGEKGFHFVMHFFLLKRRGGKQWGAS